MLPRRLLNYEDTISENVSPFTPSIAALLPEEVALPSPVGETFSPAETPLNEGEDMSWLSKQLGSLGNIVRSAAPVLSVIPGVGQVANVLGAVLPGAGSSSNPTFEAPMALPSFQSQASSANLLPAFLSSRNTGSMSMLNDMTSLNLSERARRTGTGKRYRRMNPTNPRALKKAIKRVKAFRKISHDIESMLPKRKAAPAAAPFRRRR